jgi:hypothetical protein
MADTKVFERRWDSVRLSPIAVSNHTVTVPSTQKLHTKQAVVLSLGANSDEYEIKAVISETQIRVGKKGTDIARFENPIQFNGGELVLSEQARNSIEGGVVWRAVYQEEPAVALRTMAVDYQGRAFDSEIDQDGKVRLMVSGGGSGGGSAWDKVILARDIDGDITTATYENQNVVQETYALSYDVNKDLIQVDKT